MAAETRALVEEHLKDHYGEVLLHLLIGDLRRFLLAAFKQGDEGVGDQVLMRWPPGRFWHRGLAPGQPPPQGALRHTGLGCDRCDYGSQGQAPGGSVAHAGDGQIPVGSWLAAPLDRYAQGTPVRNGTPIGYFSYHLGR